MAIWPLVLAVVAAAAMVVVAAGGGVESSAEGASHVFVVQLKGLPVANFPEATQTGRKIDTSSETVQAYSFHLTKLHDSVLEEAFQPGSYEKLYSYTVLLNAFAVKLKDVKQVDVLREHSSVVRIEQERMFHKTSTYTPKFLDLTLSAWKAAGGLEYAGENVVVGILDTGIDPKHPSFSAASSRPYTPLKNWQGRCHVSDTFPLGSCNNKIVGARHFLKGLIAANVFNATYDFDSPLDGDGHGTHTSSIAAGNHGVPVTVKNYNYGLASGMAPRARIAVYKVVYRDGGYLTDVLAGIDQAIQDGVDILSISLGSTSSANGVPFLNSFDISMLFAVKAGVLVVHAAGNNGPQSTTMNSFSPWLLSVAAATTDRSYPNPVVLGNRQEFFGVGLSAGTPPGRFYHLIYSKDAFTQNSGSIDVDYYSYCPDPTPFNKTLVQGKILICNFVQLFSGGVGTQIEGAIATAQKLGAVGLIVIPSSSDTVSQNSAVLDPVPFSMPATFIADTDDAALIFNYYNEKTSRDEFGKAKEFGASALLKDSRKAVFKGEAPEVASYSSRGPVYANTASSVTADILKPDILAPGSQIWGAWTPAGIDISGFKGESFAMVSGTSMAAPHIAGIAALVKHRHPGWSNSAIRSAILTAASPLNNRHRFILSQQPTINVSLPTGWASPFDCGSGAVNATGALDPGLIFDLDFQGYINFLCTVPGADPNSVQEATGAICKNTKGQRSSDLNLPSITVANLIRSRIVTRRVTSVSGREKYTAKIHPPAGVSVTVKPRSFTLRRGHSITFTVTLTALQANQAFTFGFLVWRGSRGHTVRMPLAISANSVSG